MPTYVIYRAGSSNSYNSNGPLTLVDAKSQDEAIAVAGKDNTVYNGQYLRAVPMSRAPRADVEAASETYSLENEIVPATSIGCILGCGRHPERDLSRAEAERWTCGRPSTGAPEYRCS